MAQKNVAAPWLGYLRRHWKLAAALLAVVLLASAAIASWLHGRTSDGKHGLLLRLSPAPSGEAFASALYQSLGVRLLTGHTLTLAENGAVFERLVEQIEGAQSSINVLMYIWEKGAASARVTAALKARAEAGVRCRILVDDLGSPDFGETVQPALAASGCEVRIFRPLSGAEKLARNHRKLIVVDGARAITGGFGIRDNWLGDGVHADAWRDSNVVFTGPAVAPAQQAFAENWQEAGGALLPLEDFPEPAAGGSVRAAFIASSGGVVTRAERLVQLMIAAAERRVWIANAYFVPSRGILQLLLQKAKAGVDVRILAPDKNSDSKTAFGAQHIAYGELLENGVRVWEYDKAMMHAKVMVVDDDLALVGSINLDPLSLNELEEDALLVQDRGFTAQLADSFGADCGRSKALRR